MGPRFTRSRLYPLALGVLTALTVGFALLHIPARSARAAGTYVVDTTSGSTALAACTSAPGDCSLPGAISNVNASPGPYLIQFNIPGPGPFVIDLAQTLNIQQQVTIDGTTQSGTSCSPVVSPLIEVTTSVPSITLLDLQGSANGSILKGLNIQNVPNINAYGIRIESGVDNVAIQCNLILRSDVGLLTLADNTLIGGSNSGEGNVISNNAAGIQLMGTNGKVLGNRIGTTPDGTASMGNNGDGIFVQNSSGSNAQIGAANAGNLISGNIVGINIQGATDDIVSGNIIGLNAAGTAALPNSQNGIQANDALRLTIGGSSAGEGNVISGNGLNGIFLGTNVRNPNLYGNFIGTNPTGTVAIPNQGSGVVFQGVDSGHIGWSTPGTRNIISGNNRYGVELGVGVQYAHVAGNYIGLNAAGNAALGNGLGGVLINRVYWAMIYTNVISGNSGDGILVTGYWTGPTTISGNYIGTSATGASAIPNAGNGVSNFDSPGDIGIYDNTIAYNTANGVQTSSQFRPSAISIATNSIYSNSGLGIDLGSDGVTPNDSGDSDGIQNYPIITNVTVGQGTAIPATPSVPSSGEVYTVSGTYNSIPGTNIAIHFYASSTCDPSGNGEGQTYLGYVTGTTDGEIGDMTFDAVTFPVVSGQMVITATGSFDYGFTSTGALYNTSEFSQCYTVVLPTPTPAPVVSVPNPSPLAFDATNTNVSNGSRTRLNVRFTNQRCDPMQDVVIRLGTGADFSILGATTDAGTATSTCSLVTNNVGTLQPGQSVTLSVDVLVSSTKTPPFDISNVVAVDFNLPTKSACSADPGGSYLRTQEKRVHILPRSLPATGYSPDSSGASSTIAALLLAGMIMLVSGIALGNARRRNWIRRIGRNGMLAILVLGASVVILALVPASQSPAMAQTGTCPALVQQALNAAQSQCAGLGRNRACYGNFQVSAQPQASAVNFRFDKSGDVVDVAAMRSLTTSPFDEKNNIWGVALLRVQASLPDSATSQNVSMIVFGGTNITDATGGSGTPLQAFTFQTGSSAAICSKVPSSGIVLQSPKGGPKVNMTANGVNLSFGSTLYLQSVAGQQLIVNTLEGKAEVTAAGVTQSAIAGTRVRVPLDSNLEPSGPPAPAEGYNLEIMPILQSEVLPESIVPADPVENPSCTP